MLIEVFADFSCPWCFIGRRRLARAQTLRPHLPMEIVWQPFQLNPELPADGIDRRQYLPSKPGDLERYHAMERSLSESGSKEGIRFAFDRIGRVPNTLAAHRLMRFAARSGKEGALAERLFSAYFERGEDIGAIGNLVLCATQTGLPARAARDFLESGAEAEAVASSDELARQGGVAGVPYFIFDRRYALAGAQEPASFLPLFDALAAGAEELMLTSV